jgi:hypothetical protein
MILYLDYEGENSKCWYLPKKYTLTGAQHVHELFYTCSNESVTSCGLVSSMNLVCVGYSVMVSLLRTRSVSEPTEPKRTLEILGRAFALARVIILGLGHRFATPFSLHLRFATQFGLNLRFATQLDLRFRFATQFCDRFL